MTESEWLACSDPQPMLAFLRDRGVSDRKLRLFAVACCRPLVEFVETAWPGMAAKLEAAERFADGLITDDELRLHFPPDDEFLRQVPAWREANPHSAIPDVAFRSLQALGWPPEEGHAWEFRPDATGFAADPLYVPRPWEPGEYLEERALQVCAFAAEARALMAVGYVWSPDAGVPDNYERQERAANAGFAAILRDIFGNPVTPVPFDPSWRTEVAVALARQMYESWDFGAMPILGDAIEEAGCRCERLLDHCRQPAEHWRGCHVVDMVLAKT